MKDEQKVFIRGVEGRGDEVVKMLTDLGAVNGGHWEGEYPSTLYYINHDGFVDHTLPSTEEGQIIMDNYRELHLPEKWEPKEDERYYYIDNDADILPSTWDGYHVDANRYNFGNVFRTREEAEAMAEKVKKLLKGE